jgi:hypothetical protein
MDYLDKELAFYTSLEGLTPEEVAVRVDQRTRQMNIEAQRLREAAAKHGEAEAKDFQVGDKVYITDAKGARKKGLKFRVSKTSPKKVFYQKKGKEHSVDKRFVDFQENFRGKALTRAENKKLALTFPLVRMLAGTCARLTVTFRSVSPLISPDSVRLIYLKLDI